MPIHLIQAPYHTDQVVAVESTRQGGISSPPFASLNLGLYTADEPDSVAANLDIFCRELEISRERLVLSRQVHGRAIATVREPMVLDGYDALITDRKGIFLGIGTADCCPVLLWDPTREAVGAVHAGWRGADLAILPATIERMGEAFDSRPDQIRVYLGTCIGPDRYEVGEDVVDRFPEVFFRPGEAEDKWLFDLKGCLMAQALGAGILSGHLSASSGCTFAEPDRFFSYRRDGVHSGRMLSVVGMR